MPTLDLKQLLDNDIITISTYDWFKPLYEKELNDIKEIQDAAQLRKLNPFFTNDNDNDSDDDDGLSTMTKTTINNIEDVQSDIQFLTDTNSSGHGNKVWHASIATCRYLKNLLLIEHDDSDDDDADGTSQSLLPVPLPLPSFHCLELGAGTALPSLFLSQLLLLLPTDTGTAGIQNKNKFIIHITDAKEYRNIKQILMSIELQLLARKSKATATATDSTDTTKCMCISYRVSPHNWGETTDLLNMNLNKKNEHAETGDELALLISTSKSYSNKSNNNIYDLIIISDCIYNPQYHDVLLDSLVSTLKLPTSEQVVEEHDGSASDGSNSNGVGNRSNGSGRAVISFSLHGNVDDSNIWSFINTKIPSRTTKMKTKFHHPSTINEQDDVNLVVYKLHARCVSTATSSSSQDNDIDIDIDNDEGWYMKETMTKLGLESDGIDEKRWYAYVYEITWVVVC
ncbi:hypothetical protein FRACYDRAFT_240899 [Fragilariopsis cylindrus CCMP1102]|uniref:Uncharacterized protein n=1 Tax=Fragilariopsis cylindrus CCMP1102 TaxID=635003 RepID=A0A1E7F899_9STRA|nr:hypothetical protein FRACYDRAFT_240899 [Fragilariopsis cylindrus CCMP1102]|eukprot:OEU14359.1 hypothetical protein FRACYDRAFT_240899 [Fragilariopsis cylindrus CCMP1102]